MANRSRRLRKKLRVDEFQEFGFELSTRLREGTNVDALVDEFFEFIISNGLVFGGGSSADSFAGFVALRDRGSVTEEQREQVAAWLKQRPEIVETEVTELVDAWY